MQKKNGRACRVLLWILAIGWAAVLFCFSGQTAGASSGLSLRITRFILRMLPSLPLRLSELHFLVRKAAHFCIFALEGFLLGLAMMKTLQKRRTGGVLAVLACVLVAVLNEFHQTFIDGRSCELRDMAIDSAGALLGVLVAAALLHLPDRRRKML